MLLPEAIDGDASREWVGGIDNPASKIESCGLYPVSLWERKQNCQCRRLDLIPLRQKVSAKMDIRHSRLSDIHDRLSFDFVGIFGRFGLMVLQGFCQFFVLWIDRFEVIRNLLFLRVGSLLRGSGQSSGDLS